MNPPNPALVTRRGARRIPRLALLFFCAAYVLPGVFGRDPWRNADLGAFGYMLAIAEGRAPWLKPMLGGVPADAALLSNWIGAAFIAVLGPGMGPALAARVPFAILLALTLALTWYTAYHLARTEAAQPVAFAFGGEAAPVDYARAIADAGVLALIATLGLLQLGHETTPELAQLCAVGLFLWALAAAPFRHRLARLAVLVALPMLSGSGAPAVALTMGLGGAAICAGSGYERVRGFAIWVLASAAAAALLGWILGTWGWRLGLGIDPAQWLVVARQWVWFMWPAWPLAAWTLWRWRRQLLNRHISAPLAVVLPALAANLWMGGSDRALLLALPGLAVLAAFALPTLRRSAAAAIDWFSMIFFCLCAIAIWVIYLAMQTGIPAQPAANVAKLAPGFSAEFSTAALLWGLAGTAAWIWLVRWRTGRHRDAVWRSLVLPAGGVALCWLLLMTLWLPLLDYARSPRPLVVRIARHVPPGSCILAPGMGPPEVAALEYFGRYRVDARAPETAGIASAACDVLLVTADSSPPPPAGWALVARERRPTDRDAVTSIYRRLPAP